MVPGGVKTDISKLDDIYRPYETVAKKGKIDVIFASAAVLRVGSAWVLIHTGEPERTI